MYDALFEKSSSDTFRAVFFESDPDYPDCRSIFDIREYCGLPEHAAIALVGWLKADQWRLDKSHASINIGRARKPVSIAEKVLRSL